MSTGKYMVELEVVDMSDAAVSGGDRVLKLRFNLDKFTREALRHALLDALVTTDQFPKAEK